MGDFNFASSSASACTMVDNFANVHGISQIASAPTRSNTLLDLVFVSIHYTRSKVINIPPIAGSDHSGQLIKLSVVRGLHNIKSRKSINYDQLSYLIIITMPAYSLSLYLTPLMPALHIRQCARDN